MDVLGSPFTLNKCAPGSNHALLYPPTNLPACKSGSPQGVRGPCQTSAIANGDKKMSNSVSAFIGIGTLFERGCFSLPFCQLFINRLQHGGYLALADPVSGLSIGPGGRGCRKFKIGLCRFQLALLV